jgi:hypothetical protein
MNIISIFQESLGRVIPSESGTWAMPITTISFSFTSLFNKQTHQIPCLQVGQWLFTI